MTKKDVCAVAKLEREVFTVPWSDKSVEWHLDTRNTVSLVMTDDSHIIAYFLGSLVLDEGEVYRIAVSPDMRKRGLGRRLLGEFMDRARMKGANTFVLEVRSQNAPAIALYESAGFTSAGIRKNYYKLPDDDGIIMRADI